MKLSLTVVAVAAVLGACAAAVIATVSGDDGDDGAAPAPTGADAAAPRASPPPAGAGPAAVPPPKVPGPTYPIAKVEEGKQVTLYDRPGGAAIGRAGDTTEFGSERNFWVRRSRGAWFGVPAAELPNGELAWIHYDPERLASTRPPTTSSPTSPSGSSSCASAAHARTLRGLRRRAWLADAAGDYAVTDGLVGKGLGPYYGCCVLALTGHQQNLPADWLGGDRIAVHGTPGAVGLAASSGCLRATDKDMVSLFARVPLGAPVFIRS